jgi:hypothetical protein
MQKKSTGRQVYRKKPDWKRAKASAGQFKHSLNSKSTISTL